VAESSMEAIAAGSVEANIFDGCRRERCGREVTGMGAAGRRGQRDRWEVWIQFWADGTFDGFNVPAIARGEIAAARARQPRGRWRMRREVLRVAGGDVDPWPPPLP